MRLGRGFLRAAVANKSTDQKCFGHPRYPAVVENTRTAKPGEVCVFGASRYLFLQAEPLLGYCGLLFPQASEMTPELIHGALGQPPRTEVTASYTWIFEILILLVPEVGRDYPNCLC